VDDATRRRVNARGWIVGLVAVLATVTPLLALSARADERYKYFVHGPDWVANPAGIPVFVFSEINDYIAQGNFRPVGRLIEHANFLAVELGMTVMSVPLPVAMGVQRAVSALLVAAALALLVTLISRFSGAAPKSGIAPRVLVMSIFGGLLVAYGSGSALNTFSGMYLQSAAIVVAAVALVLRASLWRTRPVRTIEWVAYVGAGVLLASVNEIGYLAVPAIAAVVIVQVMARVPSPPRSVLMLPGVKLSAAAAAGFLLVFVPVRMAIQAACDAAEGGCYRASAISLDAWSWRFWLARASAGLPVRGWSQAGEPGAAWVWVVVGGVVFSVVLMAVLVRARALETTEGAIESPTAPAPVAPARDALVRRAWMLGREVTMIVIGAALVVGAALLSSLSEELQASQSVEGWREAPVAMAGWALLITGLLVLVLRLTPAPRVTAAIAATLVAALVVAAVIANMGARDFEASDPGFAAGDRIALELTVFRTDAGSESLRCALLDDLASAPTVRPADAELITEVVQNYAQHHHGAPFCAEREGAE
jgi:hypothetical protein